MWSEDYVSKYSTQMTFIVVAVSKNTYIYTLYRFFFNNISTDRYTQELIIYKNRYNKRLICI